MKRSPGRDRRPVSTADSGAGLGTNVAILNALMGGSYCLFSLAAMPTPFTSALDGGAAQLLVDDATLDPSLWAIDDAGTLILATAAIIDAGLIRVDWASPLGGPSAVAYYAGGDSVLNAAAAAEIPPSTCPFVV